MSKAMASTAMVLAASNSAAGSVVAVSVTTTVVAKIRSKSDKRSGLTGTGAMRSSRTALGIFCIPLRGTDDAT
jgi:hypothetical protein